MEKGYLSIVLHAHLPYVHHPESEDYLEERWLFEAITETYLPLLEVFQGLVDDGVDFRLTMSLTPPLLSMLANPLLQNRYLGYLNQLIELAKKEVNRSKNDASIQPLADMYLTKFKRYKKLFVKTYKKNIIEGFKKYQDSGHLEIITSSATHAFLPYIQTEQGLRAQIENAIRIHTEYLGKAPRGIWLPECGFQEGLDRLLKQFGIQFFFTDSHGVLHAKPQPTHGVYAPVITPHGVAAFARDQETSKQVWSAKEGYPGDYDYREYYRDIGYDLEESYIQPYLHPSGIRHNTGIKYHRITGPGDHKEIYNLDWAREKASLHAGNFMFNREKQVEFLAAHMDRKPIVVASYDAELFGHWWYEGPMWLDFLCRKIYFDQESLKLVTPLEYLKKYPINQKGQLSFASWGRNGYGEVWLGEGNQWIYRYLHRMEKQMIQLADRYPYATASTKRALNQAARELLLAQSSDWAFIMDHRTMVDYAVKRTKNHIGRFQEIYEGLINGSLNEDWLKEVERRDTIFPNIDYRTFLTDCTLSKYEVASTREESPAMKILMLSWEYPPMTVGGLSRHVYDLSRTLAEQDVEVHVVTTHIDGYPAYELNQGVHVHRVKPTITKDISFIDWVYQLNIAMMDYCQHLIRNYGEFAIIHAHDWLVGPAAKQLKHQFKIPLVATIHATEHGRNQGIHTDLQRTIHQIEWELTYEAWRVIGCSKYMEEELKRIFHLPADKLDIIPNGVDSELIHVTDRNPSLRSQFALPHEKIIFFVGRLVREKGVHILLDSAPAILARYPDAKFVIAGKGPMLEELQLKAWEMGLGHKVLFTGFIDDETRNQLFRFASVTVFPSIYEPFGIVALEAMAAGVPVIVSGVGGLQEIIEYGVDGYTVLPGDVPSLVNHITKMLEDPQAAHSMAQKAAEKVNRMYNWEKIALQTLNTYHRVIMEAECQSAYDQVAVAEWK